MKLPVAAENFTALLLMFSNTAKSVKLYLVILVRFETTFITSSPADAGMLWLVSS